MRAIAFGLLYVASEISLHRQGANPVDGLVGLISLFGAFVCIIGGW